MSERWPNKETGRTPRGGGGGPLADETRVSSGSGAPAARPGPPLARKGVGDGLGDPHPNPTRHPVRAQGAGDRAVVSPARARPASVEVAAHGKSPRAVRPALAAKRRGSLDASRGWAC